jgi:hypothetical protein
MSYSVLLHVNTKLRSGATWLHLLPTFLIQIYIFASNIWIICSNIILTSPNKCEIWGSEGGDYKINYSGMWHCVA